MNLGVSDQPRSRMRWNIAFAPMRLAAGALRYGAAVLRKKNTPASLHKVCAKLRGYFLPVVSRKPLTASCDDHAWPCGFLLPTLRRRGLDIRSLLSCYASVT